MGEFPDNNEKKKSTLYFSMESKKSTGPTFKCVCVCLCLEHKQGKGERERERESKWLHAEPDAGLDLTTVRS